MISLSKVDFDNFGSQFLGKSFFLFFGLLFKRLQSLLFRLLNFLLPLPFFLRLLRGSRFLLLFYSVLLQYLVVLRLLLLLQSCVVRTNLV